MKLFLWRIVNGSIVFGCFFCIYYSHRYLINGSENTLMIAAFGAYAVFEFSEQNNRAISLCVCISTLVTALIGVFFSKLNLPEIYGISMSMAFCVWFLNTTNSNFPPAGAISIIPLISNSDIQNLGYLFLLYPTLTGFSIIYAFSKFKNKLYKYYYGKQKIYRNSKVNSSCIRRTWRKNNRSIL